MSYSPHALQQRRAGGHGTSLNLREDPGSLPFALILVAAVAGKDSSKCGRGTTLGIIIYFTVKFCVCLCVMRCIVSHEERHVAGFASGNTTTEKASRLSTDSGCPLTLLVVFLALTSSGLFGLAQLAGVNLEHDCPTLPGMGNNYSTVCDGSDDFLLSHVSVSGKATIVAHGALLASLLELLEQEGCSSRCPGEDLPPGLGWSPNGSSLLCDAIKCDNCPRVGPLALSQRCSVEITDTVMTLSSFGAIYMVSGARVERDRATAARLSTPPFSVPSLHRAVSSHRLMSSPSLPPHAFHAFHAFFCCAPSPRFGCRTPTHSASWALSRVVRATTPTT